ncbi:ABC-three component system protein [Haliscomenobacter sp.]|uniref:ABC-three component system protein n=1 Tax=Haliscomenobacter sp. TaxID=2717303 RepID=UPI003593E4F2
MNNAERYFAKILFRNKIYEYKGAEFQKFFVEIMGRANPHFRTIKPQGPLGDWKNDGYDDKVGVFYQVYAPEQPEEIDVPKTVKKLVESFEGIIEKWNHLTPVLRFYFVFNDEFRYAYPEVEGALLELTQKHNIPCEPFLSKDLQHIFESLTDDDKMFCLRFAIPNVEDLGQIVGFEALNEVVKHLLESPFVVRKPLAAARPGFVKKIQFNSLSSQVADLLKMGEFQIGTLQTYFELESDLKSILQEKFSGLYEQGKKEIVGDHGERSDEIFFYIFGKSTPNETPSHAISPAIIALMSYYFESCDIFEPPKTELFD